MKKKLLSLMCFFALATANAQNPYLPLWEHLPDGEPRVFEDPDHPGKLQLFNVHRAGVGTLVNIDADIT